MKLRSLPRAFPCLRAHFVPARNLHVAFGKENFSLPSTALNVLRALHFSLLSLTPTLIFIIQISEELLNIWLNAAIFIGALAECGNHTL